MANLLNDKWSFWLSIVLFLAFSVLSVYYFIDILNGDTRIFNIISLLVWIASAVLWLVKALQHRKKMKAKGQG